MDHEVFPQRGKRGLSGSGESQISNHQAQSGVENWRGGYSSYPEISHIKFQKFSQ